MDNDDEPIGRLLTRREAIALGGTPALVWLAGCTTTSSSGSSEAGEATNTTAATTDETPADEVTTAAAMSTDDSNYPVTGTVTGTSVTTDDGSTACVAQPELTEGPYYVDENLRRSDIRSDSDTGERQDGVRLDLGFRVFELREDGCVPLDDAIVDVWHANAFGVYSDVRAQSTVGEDFLRGIQLTGNAGAASFTTIYPGWYPGRAVHVHFKIRSSAASTGAYEFTSQLFFDDGLTDQVYTQEPYAGQGERDTRNSEDTIFGQTNDERLVLDLTETEAGYAGTLDVALYTDGETAEDDSFSGGDGGGGGPPSGSEPPNGVPSGAGETADAA
jgi:protocatechuate 3,4-dioxygenase beta subunit